MTELRTEAAPCRHTSVVTFSNAVAGGTAVLWACDDCRIRFYPHDAAGRSDAGREAVTAALARLRARVKGLLSLDELHADGPGELYDRDGRVVAWPALVDRAAVLAIFDEENR